jgi:hypothetical protein
MIRSAVNISVMMLFAFVLLAPNVRADKEPSQETPATVQAHKPDNVKAQPKAEDPKQAEPTQSYDDFTDENHNGIDDKFEKAEKKKVKVQEAVERTKPAEPQEREKAQKKIAPEK